MRHLASRGARMAAFLIDCLLLALVPAALLYPAYYLFVPPEPSPPLLPIELLTPEERGAFTSQQAAWESRFWLVIALCVTAFAFSFLLYSLLALTTSRRGQTLGMATASIRVVSRRAPQLSFPRAFFRALFITLGATLFVGSLGVMGYGLLRFLPPADFSRGFKLILAGVGGIIWLLLFLIRRGSVLDFITGTHLVTLSGDIIEERPRTLPTADDHRQVAP